MIGKVEQYLEDGGNDGSALVETLRKAEERKAAAMALRERELEVRASEIKVLQDLVAQNAQLLRELARQRV